MKLNKKIIIIANERAGYVTAAQIIEKGYDVLAVFTSHESRKNKIADYKDFSPLKEKYPQIPFYFIAGPKEQGVVEKMEALKPDLIVVISWSQILPQDLISIPMLGTIGIHYSLLPERRGGAPLAWAIIDGLEKTGLTLFYYDEGIDSGDIIDQVELEIKSDDTARTMLDKIETELPKLVFRNLDTILQGKNKRIKQDENKVSYTKVRVPADGEINWVLNNKKIYDFIRAQTYPYPCAFTKITDKNGKIKKLVIPRACIKDDKLFIKGFIEDF